MRSSRAQCTDTGQPGQAMGQENEGSEVWGGEHRVVGVAPSRCGTELGGRAAGGGGRNCGAGVGGRISGARSHGGG